MHSDLIWLKYSYNSAVDKVNEFGIVFLIIEIDLKISNLLSLK